jgi:peroxiredoxin
MSKRSVSKRRRAQQAQTTALVLAGGGLLLLGLVIFLAFSRSGARANQPEQITSVVPVKVEFDAPKVEVIDINEQEVALSDFAGQIVLVNNWATWCPPCKAEMPTLLAYYQAHQNDGFVLVAINSGDSLEQVQDFAEQYGLTFPVWVDPQSVAMRAFRASSLPTSYVIDRSGTVRLAWTGAVSRTVLEKYVTPLITQ